ncbi:MAG: hypothetical protein ACI9NY_000304 [Kiritimatiellia bacterium]|jgi:hypothetical protein
MSDLPPTIRSSFPSPSPSLADWQADFSRSLLSDLTSRLSSSFQSVSNHASQQRFAIYQNNVFHSLTTALGDLYPVIKKLVGDDFFMATAGVYLREHPPQQAAMVNFGQDFPNFLNHFEHTCQLPYLSPVATLELARQRAYHAEDKDPLTAEVLASIPPERLASAKIGLHPSLQLLSAEQPIFSIWQANQDEHETEENININEPQQVLVVRPLYVISMYNIDTSTYQLLNCLSNGDELRKAIETTLDTDQTADISQIIHFLIEAQLFSSIVYNKKI